MNDNDIQDNINLRAQEDNYNENQMINNGNRLNNNNSFENNLDESKKYCNLTISFFILFFINIVFITISKFYFIDISKYVFQYIFIINYSQYYRFITRYFIHFGFCHFILELYITYCLCKFFENSIGTMMTIALIMVSMIMDSLIQVLIILFLRLIVYIFQINSQPNFEYEGGLTPVLFTLYTFYFIFKKKNINEINLTLFGVNAKYSSFLVLIVLYFFTPNSSFYGNISGIICAFVIKKYAYIFLPKVIWIREIEYKLNLKTTNIYSKNMIKNIYRNINIENPTMKLVLNEIFPNSMNEEPVLEKGNNFNPYLTELPLVNGNKKEDNIRIEVIDSNN